MPPVDPWTLATIATGWLVYASALLAAGGVWFVLAQPRLPPTARASVAAITSAVAVIGILATAGQLAVQAGHLIDDGWRGMIDPQMLRLVADGPLGTASGMRIGALALVASLPLARSRLLWLPATGALLVAGSFTLSGHVSHESLSRALPAALLVVHLIGASFWLGALWPLYRLAGDSVSRASAASVAERFGHQAGWAVAALLVAGTALAWLLLGSVQALYTTDYGRVLLAKITLVGMTLGLAAVNRWRLVPALRDARDPVAARAARTLRRAIGLETLLIITALLAVAVLTSATAPPVDRAAELH